MAGSRVGRVTHYFDRIGVAAITLEDDLAKGDRVQFVRRGQVLFEQEVASMQIDRRNIESARKGDDIGLRVLEEVKEGTEVYRL